jgi:hypothetical protein
LSFKGFTPNAAQATPGLKFEARKLNAHYNYICATPEHFVGRPIPVRRRRRQPQKELNYFPKS